MPGLLKDKWDIPKNNPITTSFLNINTSKPRMEFIGAIVFNLG